MDYKKRFLNNASVRTALFTCAVLTTFLTGCGSSKKENAVVTDRIISLSPSITETLFALGLGEKVAGVTSYCSYPPQVNSIEKIGGYTDPNLEKIVTLDPDLVVLHKEHEKQRKFLKRYGIRTLIVNYSSTADICSSFVKIGRVCGARSKADSLTELFDSMINTDSLKNNRPDVLICVGRESPGGGSVQSVYAGGAGTFYNNLILAAGGRNAYRDTLPRYPKLSREGLIVIAPDIIIDIASAMGTNVCSTLVKNWMPLEMIPAVKNNRVYCISERYATVPGPGSLELLQDLKRIIHTPGLKGEK